MTFFRKLWTDELTSESRSLPGLVTYLMKPAATSVAVRLFDQGCWSAGFFAFNVVASLVFSTSEFAALAVVTSVVFIVIAVARAGAINARVVAGARFGVAPESSLSRGVAAKWSLAGSLISVLVLFAILLGDVSVGLLAGLLALCISLILSDMPHQLLIFRSSYSWAAMLASCYMMLGLAVFIVQHLVSSTVLVYIWASAGAVLIISGITFVNASVRSPADQFSVGSFSWRLAAESLYVGVSGQFAILILYLLSNTEASAGFRYSYALVFAPAFMIIQGLSPLFIKSLAKFRRGPELARRSLIWSGFVFVTLAMSAGVALIVSRVYPEYDALVVAQSFMLPVGVSVLSAQLLEGVTSASRFLLEPKSLHRLRILVVGLDMLSQVVGVVLFDVEGLVVAICFMAVVKFVVCIVLIVVLLRGRIHPSV